MNNLTINPQINSQAQMENQLRNINNRSKSGNTADAQLKEACSRFEGLMIGMLLKQALKPGIIDEQESANGNGLRDFVIEEVARDLGRAESFGISKLLYQQIKENNNEQQ
jgi:Rod binding domain-containing protein